MTPPVCLRRSSLYEPGAAAARLAARAFALEAQRIAAGQTLVRRDLLAIRFCLMAVGEALYWVPETMLLSESAIPWRKVDEDIIVEIARNEIDPLVSALTRLIEKFA